MQGRCANFLKGEGSKNFTETIEFFFEQGFNSFRRTIKAGYPGAAGGDCDLDVGVVNPAGDNAANLANIVLYNLSISQDVACVGQATDQQIA